mgnify:CR=1 FL=1
MTFRLRKFSVTPMLMLMLARGPFHSHRNVHRYRGMCLLIPVVGIPMKMQMLAGTSLTILTGRRPVSCLRQVCVYGVYRVYIIIELVSRI